MVSYWLPGVGWPSSLGERDSCQWGRATSQPGPTSRASGDNVTGQIMSLGLGTVSASFLRVFPLLSKCITRKCQWTLHRGSQIKKQWKTILRGMSNSFQWPIYQSQNQSHISVKKDILADFTMLHIYRQESINHKTLFSWCDAIILSHQPTLSQV